MNITIYGDSILKGILLENGRYRINHEWEKYFTTRYGFSVNNRSRFGCTIRKALPMIRKDNELSVKDNSYVLLELGGNDCDYDWSQISAEPKGSYDCKTPPVEFLNEYRDAIDLLKQNKRIPVLATLPPIHSERYLQYICRDGLSRRNILSWLGDVDAIYRWQEKYSAMVEQIASEEKVKLIDIRKAFLRSERNLEDLLCIDGIHPSREGQALIFETLCAAI